MSPTPLAQRITLKHLRLIAAIAEHRQLSLAAQALSLTQPAASRSLGEIEQLCGAAIFERHARGMTLTPAGELLARRARNVLEEIGEASAEVARYRDGRGGMVRIGAVTGGAIGTIVPVVQRLRPCAPEAEIHVEVAMSRELVRDLLALRLDFVLARLPPEAQAPEFEVVRASHELVDIVVGAGHPLAGRRAVGLTELLDCDWVMQSSGAPIRVGHRGGVARGRRPAARAGHQHLVAAGDDRDARELRSRRAGQPRGRRAARRRRTAAPASWRCGFASASSSPRTRSSRCAAGTCRRRRRYATRWWPRRCGRRRRREDSVRESKVYGDPFGLERVWNAYGMHM